MNVLLTDKEAPSHVIMLFIQREAAADQGAHQPSSSSFGIITFREAVTDQQTAKKRVLETYAPSDPHFIAVSNSQAGGGLHSSKQPGKEAHGSARCALKRTSSASRDVGNVANREFHKL